MAATKRRRWPALLFLLPAVLLLLGFLAYPIVWSVVRSLFDAGGHTFVGLGNYQTTFTDPETLTALRNTVIWVIVAPTVATALGLLFAVLTERIGWSTVFKSMIFMPMAISFLASGVIFRLVYDQDPAKGVLNAALVGVHDTVSPAAHYPGARVRDTTSFPATVGGFTSAKAVKSGADPVGVGLLAIDPQDVPSSSKSAAQARPAGPGTITGTVWLDFTRGGGGKPNAIDPTEPGLPGVQVQAVRDGSVAATATTTDDGTFALSGLDPGSYTLTLPAANFAPPFNGVTWLGPTLVTPAIIGAYVWIYAGFAMVLISAGMASIPRDALEAARIDGANEWRVFRYITVPLLSPVLIVVFVTLIINVLKVFDLVYIIAPGSVQPDATVLALQMWKVSFGGGQDQGLGSAISIFLLLLVLPAMIVNIRRFRREDT